MIAYYLKQVLVTEKVIFSSFFYILLFLVIYAVSDC